jgi:hypothetical protein
MPAAFGIAGGWVTPSTTVGIKIEFGLPLGGGAGEFPQGLEKVVVQV